MPPAPSPQQTPHRLRVQLATYNYNLRSTPEAPVPDFTPWLVPTLSETDARYTPTTSYYSTSSSSSSYADAAATGTAHKGSNATNPADHATAVRDAPDLYAVGFQELLPLHDAFASRSAAFEAVRRTDVAVRRAVRPHAAVVSPQPGKYAAGRGPEDYALVAEVRLVGLLLLVYARETPSTPGHRSAAERVKEVRVSSASTGLVAGLLGNKGAVGARIVLSSPSPLTKSKGEASEGIASEANDEVLSFVCAHLAAHDHNVPRRNRDWRDIVQRLAFPPDSIVDLPALPFTPGGAGDGKPLDVDELQRQHRLGQRRGGGKGDGRRKPTALDSRTYNLYDASHVLVMGDLNYRVALKRPACEALLPKGAVRDASEVLKKADVKRKIQQEDWRTLARYDQLSLELRRGGGGGGGGPAAGSRTLHGLVEVPPTSCGFPPTYKYKVAKKPTDKPVAASELSGKRVPGWTDRILWASVGGWKEPSSSDEGKVAPLNVEDVHGVEVEVYRSVMSFTQSDHKPVTAILRLPLLPSPQSSTTSATTPSLLPSDRLTPYARLSPHWRLHRQVGATLDVGLGHAWLALRLAGAGNELVGVANLVVAVAVAAWYLGLTPSSSWSLSSSSSSSSL